jgi:hypothetical protein
VDDPDSFAAENLLEREARKRLADEPCVAVDFGGFGEYAKRS